MEEKATVIRSETKVSAQELIALRDIFRVREVSGGYEISDGIAEDVEEYVIPDFVVSIGENAFDGFDSLSELTVPASVKHIDGNAMGNCFPNIVNMTVSQAILNELSKNAQTLRDVFDADLEYNISFAPDVTVITKGVLSGFCFEELDFRKSNLKSIEAFAFADCEIGRIYLGDTIQNIDEEAFSDCYGLETVTLTANCPLSIRELRDVFEDCKITRS